MRSTPQGYPIPAPVGANCEPLEYRAGLARYEGVSNECRDLGLLVGAFADGEIGGEDAILVRTHLADCADCRRVLKTLARLNLRIASAPAPAFPPQLADRIRRGLDAAERSGTRRRLVAWIAPFAAAAGLLLSFLLLPTRDAVAEVPAFVRATSEAHDRLVATGRLPEAAPEAVEGYFRDKLKLELAPPNLGAGTCCEGGCSCEVEGSAKAVPWILYRKGPVPISLLVVPDSGAALPDSARRTRNGRPYHVFRCGPNTVVLCRAGSTCHAWIGRLPEAELVDLVLDTPEGRLAFDGERLSVEGVTCGACCTIAEGAARKVAGVADAKFDPVSMQLVVSAKGTLDLDAVIRALKEAGFDAKR